MPSAIAPDKLTADGSRYRLPKGLTDHIEWLADKKTEIAAWLFVVGAGRLRLLSDDEVTASPRLDSIRSLVLSGRTDDSPDPIEVLPAESASLPSRLLRISLMPHASSGWRMAMRQDIDLWLPDGFEADQWIMHLTAEGFWELWHIRTFRQAVSSPLPA